MPICWMEGCNNEQNPAPGTHSSQGGGEGCVVGAVRGSARAVPNMAPGGPKTEVPEQAGFREPPW